MKLLLKHVTISDVNSPYNTFIKDILITNGLVENIADNIDDAEAELLNAKGMMISPGWVDIFAHFNDPGLEFKETLESGANAAAAGGFTNIFVVPNTQPPISGKSVVEYIVQKAKHLPVNIFPLGSISKNIEGKELSEMYDMQHSGALAFTDGVHPVQSMGLMLKALQYVKAVDGVIIQMPVDKSISKFGLINEGITSTQLGLPGIPAIAEELMIGRDIELAKYTQSKLHITGVSTAKGLAVITQAKKEGVQVTCSITPYHLFYCDEDLTGYDTHLKTDPPLRSREDRIALRQGILNGNIDCIATHHFPQNQDNKICEFEYALPGMIGLQTAFSTINTILPEISDEQLLRLFCNNARQIFSLPNITINIGEKAEFTLFNRKDDFTLTTTNNKSKSNNSPYLNMKLSGKVVGIINKDKVYLNS